MASAGSVAEALEQLSQGCEELDLQSVEIGDEGAKELAVAFKTNKALTKLQLYKNNIGNEGAQGLAEALKESQTLMSLWVNRNVIGKKGSKALGAARDAQREMLKELFEEPPVPEHEFGEQRVSIMESNFCVIS